MLLVQDPQLLLLDEPVAGMSKAERTKTGELLQLIARTRTLIVIEHDMDFVRRFASKVTVMHEGKLLCEGPVAEVQANPMVQEVYLGRAARPPSAHEPSGRLMLEVEDLDVAYGPTQVLFGVSLEVPANELVCVMGRNGVGKTTLLNTIMGVLKPVARPGHVRGQGPRPAAPLRAGQGRAGLRPADPGQLPAADACWRT